MHEKRSRKSRQATENPQLEDNGEGKKTKSLGFEGRKSETRKSRKVTYKMKKKTNKNGKIFYINEENVRKLRKIKWKEKSRAK